MSSTSIPMIANALRFDAQHEHAAVQVNCWFGRGALIADLRCCGLAEQAALLLLLPLLWLRSLPLGTPGSRRCR